jgi:hypothetical protein
MNKNNTNIDDLFEAARQQKPLITIDDARNLIEGGATIASGEKEQILKTIKGMLFCFHY